MAPHAQVAGLSVREASSLHEAFELKPGEVVSLVGGGGKTSLMFRLAHELASQGKSVITTTTTRILPPTKEESACVIVEEDEEKLIERLKSALESKRHVTLARLKPDDGKLKGLLPETVDRLTQMKLVDYIVNEADGSARKPIKAPNATEPVIPSRTSLVIAVVGWDALGARLGEDTAFRPELISRLTGLSLGESIKEDDIASLLTHRQGIIQHSPEGARIIAFINKMDLTPDTTAALALAHAILARRHPQLKRVVLASLQKPGSPPVIIQA